MTFSVPAGLASISLLTLHEIKGEMIDILNEEPSKRGLYKISGGDLARWEDSLNEAIGILRNAVQTLEPIADAVGEGSNLDDAIDEILEVCGETDFVMPDPPFECGCHDGLTEVTRGQEYTAADDVRHHETHIGQNPIVAKSDTETSHRVFNDIQDYMRAQLLTIPLTKDERVHAELDLAILPNDLNGK